MTIEKTGTLEPVSSSQYSFSQYIANLLSAAARATWPRRYAIIDEMVTIYRDEHGRSAPGKTKIEEALYAHLIDQSTDAPVHQIILLTTARFTQIERGTTVGTATETFEGLDIPASAADRRTRALMDRRGPRHHATVRHLLPAAVALHGQNPELLDRTLVRWQTRGGEVADIARQLQNALAGTAGSTKRRRPALRALGVLLWIAVLLVPLFLTMVLCANLYTDHLALFFRHTIY